MKRKIVFGLVAFLLVLQAQAVFAADYDEDFLKELDRNNIGNIEKLLQRRAKQMNLAFCINAAIKPSNWKNTKNFNRANCLDVVKLLVNYGADVNSQYILYSVTYDRPLLLAINQEQPSIPLIRFLLDSGARTDFKPERWTDENGSPIPLILAVYSLARQYNHGNEIVNLLLDHGAKGESLLPTLGATGDNELIRRLIARGVPIRSNEGAEALRNAAKYSKFDTVKLLVENGVNVNARDTDGSTALSLAYDKGEMDIYDYLKANGARDFEPRQVTQQPAAPAPSQSTTNVYVQPSTPSQSTQSTNQSQPAGWNLSVMSGTNNIGGTWNSSVGNGFMVLNGTGTSGSVNIQANGKNSSGTATISGNFLNLYITDGQFKGQQFRYTIVTNKLIQGDGENFSRY